MGSDGITNDRGKISESHPQDPRSLSQLILRCIVRRNRINRREGLDVRARGACYPSSDKGTRFYASLSSIRAVYSSRPESRQLVACLCPWLMDIYECGDGRRMCAYVFVCICVPIARKERRDERVSCEWRWYSISGHYIHHATMREVLMTLHTRTQTCNSTVSSWFSLKVRDGIIFVQ